MHCCNTHQSTALHVPAHSKRTAQRRPLSTMSRTPLTRCLPCPGRAAEVYAAGLPEAAELRGGARAGGGRVRVCGAARCGRRAGPPLWQPAPHQAHGHARRRPAPLAPGVQRHSIACMEPRSMGACQRCGSLRARLWRPGSRFRRGATPRACWTTSLAACAAPSAWPCPTPACTSSSERAAACAARMDLKSAAHVALVAACARAGGGGVCVCGATPRAC